MQKHEETRAKFFTDKLPSRLRLSISQADVPTFPGGYVPGQKVLTSHINQLHHCYVWFWPHILAHVYTFTLLPMRPRPSVADCLKVLNNPSQSVIYRPDMARQWPKGQVRMINFQKVVGWYDLIWYRWTGKEDRAPRLLRKSHATLKLWSSHLSILALGESLYKKRTVIWAFQNSFAPCHTDTQGQLFRIVFLPFP